MKKLHLFLLAIALSITTSYAQTANVYASGLTAASPGATSVDVTYFLNTDATAVAVNFIDAEGVIVATVPVTDAALLTKGAHTATVPYGTTVPSGTYKWSVTATATANEGTAPVKLSNDDPKFAFYLPRGVVVDNNFDSPYFGQVYVSEGAGGKVSGIDRTTQDGIYIFNPALEDYTAQGVNAYAGGVAWTSGEGISEGAASPTRITIAENGKVYIADNSVVNSGVWIMDPANPSAAFTSVFDNTGRDADGIVGTVHGRVSGLSVIGSGSDTKLYTVDRNLLPVGVTAREYIPAGFIYQYNIGELTVPHSLAPDAVIYDNPTSGIANDALTLSSDNRGGWFLFQNRSTDMAIIPSLTHINAAGEVDYKSAGELGGSVRGAAAINKDGTLFATAVGSGATGNKSINVYSLAWNEDTGAPVLTKVDALTITGLGNNIDGLGFDAADNLYILSASTERLFVYALPQAENTFTTPAPVASTIAVTNSNYTGIAAPVTKSIAISGAEKAVKFSAAVASAQVYTIAGALVAKTANASSVSVATSGVYVVKAITANGESVVAKVLVK